MCGSVPFVWVRDICIVFLTWVEDLCTYEVSPATPFIYSLLSFLVETGDSFSISALSDFTPF